MKERSPNQTALILNQLNDNTHMCVCTTSSFNKSKSMECVKTPDGTTPLSLCDPEIVEGQDPISTNKAPDERTTTGESRNITATSVEG